MDKTKKTIFFINGPVPTDEDKTEAAKLAANGGMVVFRNAQFDPGEGALEYCTAVAGCAPDRYKSAYNASAVATAATPAKADAPKPAPKAVATAPTAQPWGKTAPEWKPN